MSTHTNEWFNKRGMTAYQYQVDIIDSKIDDSFKRNGYAVLAAAPNAGKTLMSICYIEKFLSENPNARVLVLTHGTTVLRDQFYEELQKTVPSFSFCAVESGMDINDFDCQVCVGLPQSLNNKSLPKFDLFIVDEAHQFYFIESNKKIGMVQDIEEKIDCKYKLFLTGTPAKFIYNKYEIIPISVNTLHDNGQISDLIVEIATMNVDIKHTDYNKDYNIDDNKFEETTEHTYSALDSALKEMEKRLKSFIKDSPKYYSAINQKLGLAPSIFGSIDKTMIACRNKNQAKDVKKYFESKNIKCALSISGEGQNMDSTQITEFKINPEIKILIVVYRGILGFNMPELENVIDMTGSQNLDRVFQLMARVTRKHPNGKKKLFIKVAGKNQIDYTNYIMGAVLCLCDDRWYTEWNGRNFLDFKVPSKKYTSTKIGSTKIKTTNKKVSKPIQFLGLPAIEFFKELLHKRDDAFSGVSYTSIKDVRRELFDYAQLPSGYWTYEKCLEEALKYDSIKEWKLKGGETAYNKACKNKWIKDCVKHMEILRIDWTYEKCLEEALKYDRPVDWQKNSGSSYQKSKKQGWFNDLSKHMVSQKLPGYWTYEKCLEEALKYDRPVDWQNSDKASYVAAVKLGKVKEISKMLKNRRIPLDEYNIEDCIKIASKYSTLAKWIKGDYSFHNAALKNGWIEKCSQHMIKRSYKWTLDMCLADALKYENKKDWNIFGKASYVAASKNGWIEECSKHMKQLRIYNWTPEICKKEVLKYKTKTEWQKNSISSYNYARKNSIVDECCTHMNKIKKPNGYWNIFENVLNDAKKYQTRSEWDKNSSSAYTMAYKNGWLNECCAHMTCGRKNKKKK